MSKGQSGRSAGRRRDKGDGSISYKKSEKRWIASFYKEDGSRKWIAGRVGGTKPEIKQKLEAAIAADKRGQLVAFSSQTLEEYLQVWFEEKALEIRPSTQIMWESHIDLHILPYLGSRQIQKLKREHIQEWVTRMAKEEERTPSTLKKTYDILHLAFVDAVRRGIIGINPCTDITLPRIDEREMQVLDIDQARTFLFWLKEQKHPSEALFALAITTGARQGELLALRWSDVDMERGRIQIQRTVKYINKRGFVEGETKTRGSRRAILLTSETIKILRNHRKRQLEDGITSNLVFPSSKTGSFRLFTGVDQLLKRILAAARLPDIRFHDLRHTAATLMLRSGATLKAVQRVLGHSNIATTMKYLHILPDMEEEDARRLDECLFAQRKIAR